MTDNRLEPADYPRRPDGNTPGHWSQFTSRFHVGTSGVPDECIFCIRERAALPTAPPEPGPDPNAEPGFLQAMRSAAVQRPRTQSVKIRWATLQVLLNERDALWGAASEETRARIEATHHKRNYGYQRPAGYTTPRYRKEP